MQIHTTPEELLKELSNQEPKMMAQVHPEKAVDCCKAALDALRQIRQETGKSR